MTELWLFYVFDLQNRGRGQDWGQNRGQFWLGNIYVYFLAKFQGPSSKIDWVMTILVFRFGKIAEVGAGVAGKWRT